MPWAAFSSASSAFNFLMYSAVEFSSDPSPPGLSFKLPVSREAVSFPLLVLRDDLLLSYATMNNIHHIKLLFSSGLPVKTEFTVYFYGPTHQY